MFRLIRKDSGEGVICAVSRGQIVVAPISLTGLRETVSKKQCAAGCGKCLGCLSLISVPSGYAGRFRISVNNASNFKLGDRVLFNRFIPEPNLTSAIIFGIPILFSMATMLCWFIRAPQSVESAAAAWSIAAAFFSGFLILGALDNFFRKKYPASITLPDFAPRVDDGRFEESVEFNATIAKAKESSR